MEKVLNERYSELLSDYEIGMTEEDLDRIDLQLSQEEEEQMQELLDMSKNADVKDTLLHDIIEATKKGSLDFLNSFTDTMDTFDEMKNPQSVRKWNDTEIDKARKPATPQNDWETRTMRDARTNPFDSNVSGDTSNMSSAGQKKFEQYKEAYAQRTKSLTNISANGNSVERSNNNVNNETLSGLRSYRIGPVVPMPSAEETQLEYTKYKANDGQCEPTSWLRQRNYDDFDNELVKQFGFKNKAQAAKWREENHLTIHEGPEGMFLVPSDVHDAARHNGYCSQLSKLLNGKVSAEDVQKWVHDERVAVVAHECKIRATRAVKGIGMSIVKDLLKSFIFITGEEVYIEFKRTTDEKFVERVKHLLQQIFTHLKKKCAEKLRALKDTILNGVKGTLISEFFTLLNDYIFKTVKNIFKIVRTMWSSILKALKVIFSSKSSWEDRIFEATKILTAGMIGVLGFSLNELIDKGLTSIGIPFSSFIAECLSGLFAGIMSAVVLVVFDNIKGKMHATSIYVQRSLLESKLIALDSARITISSLKLDMKAKDTYVFFGMTMQSIKSLYEDINVQQSNTRFNLTQAEKEIEEQKTCNNRLEKLKEKYLNDDEF